MAITNWSKVTVRYNFGATDDSAVTSPDVVFTPEVAGNRFKDASLKEIVYARTIIGRLNSTGTGSVDLYATDDPDILPTGWTYQVREPNGYTYSISVPIANVTGGIDLADLAPVNPSGGTGGTTGTLGSESAAGIVQFASAADVSNGTALDRAVSPGRLAAKTWPTSSIVGFVEAIQDTMAATLVAGANVTLTYNDTANTLTVAAAGGTGTGGLDAEGVMDTMGAALQGTGLVAVTYNDVANTLIVSTTATANSADATLLARANHTGTQTADTLTDGTVNKVYTGTEKTKLSSIAAGATANAPDATLLNRANHTGTQTSGTISDFTEAAQDAVAAMLVAGTGVTVTYNDTANTLTIAATGGGTGGLDASSVRAEVEAELIAGTNVTITPSGTGAARALTIAATGGGATGGTGIPLGYQVPAAGFNGGVVDATAAIQAVIDTGAPLYLGPGTWRCTSSLKVDAGTVIYVADGCLLQKDFTNGGGLQGGFITNRAWGSTGPSGITKVNDFHIYGPGEISAKRPSVRATNGVMANGSTTLTSATAAWTANDVGRGITVSGAGAGGGLLTATINSRTSATAVVLSVAASTATSGATLTHIAYGNILSICGDRTIIEEFRTTYWSGGRHTVLAGDYCKTRNVRWTGGGGTTNNEGHRFVGGTNFVGMHMHIESGDDALEFVPTGAASDPTYNMSIYDSVYIGCTGGSTDAKFMVAGLQDSSLTDGVVGTMSSSLINSGWIGCSGYAHYISKIQNISSSGQVSGVFMTNCTVDMNPDSSTGIADPTTGGAQELIINGHPTTGGINNITITRLVVRNSVRRCIAMLRGSDNVTFRDCRFVRGTSQTTEAVLRLGGRNTKVINCTIDGVNTGQPLVLIQDMDLPLAGAPAYPAGTNVDPDHVLIDSCRFRNIGSGTDAYGIDIENGNAVAVTDCWFESATGATNPKVARIAAGVTNTRLSGNDWRNLAGTTAKITDAGTGTIVTFDDPNRGITRTVDGAAVNNSTTVITDSLITLPVIAGATYRFAADVFYDADTAADFKISWATPTGTTGYWNPDAVNLAATTALATVNRPVTAITAAAATGGAGVGTIVGSKPSGIFTTTTGGNFALRYAQNTAAVSDATLRAGTTLTLTRIA